MEAERLPKRFGSTCAYARRMSPHRVFIWLRTVRYCTAIWRARHPRGSGSTTLAHPKRRSRTSSTPSASRSQRRLLRVCPRTPPYPPPTPPRQRNMCSVCLTSPVFFGTCPILKSSASSTHKFDTHPREPSLSRLAPSAQGTTGRFSRMGRRVRGRRTRSSAARCPLPIQWVRSSSPTRRAPDSHRGSYKYIKPPPNTPPPNTPPPNTPPPSIPLPYHSSPHIPLLTSLPLTCPSQHLPPLTPPPPPLTPPS